MLHFTHITSKLHTDAILVTINIYICNYSKRMALTVLNMVITDFLDTMPCSLVSREYASSIFRVEDCQGSSNLKQDTARSSETSVTIYQSTRNCILRDSNLYIQLVSAGQCLYIAEWSIPEDATSSGRRTFVENRYLQIAEPPAVSSCLTKNFASSQSP